MMLKLCVLGALATVAAAHSNLIYPKPRNAVDSFDPRWEHGKNSPDLWQAKLGPVLGQACACRNGSSTCDIGQTCLWMSVGCSLGCKECDGGTINGKSVGTNPNGTRLHGPMIWSMFEYRSRTYRQCASFLYAGIDRCGSGLKPWTNNDPLTRTFNRNCTGPCIGSEHDFTKYNP